MNLERFLDGYTEKLFCSSEDSRFEVLRVLLGGLSSARVAKLLNFSTRCLDFDECYTEIGVYKGFTLVSAGYETNALVVGIDHFKPEWNTNLVVDPKELAEKISTFGVKFKLIHADFRNVNDVKKIGSLFIDGDHNYDEVKSALLWSESFLSDRAVIILADAKVDGVRDAVRDWTQEHEQYEEIFFAKTFHTEQNGKINDRFVQNGISIMTYRKS